MYIVLLLSSYPSPLAPSGEAREIKRIILQPESGSIKTDIKLVPFAKLHVYGENGRGKYVT